MWVAKIKKKMPKIFRIVNSLETCCNYNALRYDTIKNKMNNDITVLFRLLS